MDNELNNYQNKYPNFQINLDNEATGFYNNINVEQIKILENFRQLIIDEKIVTSLERFNDLRLLKFLRARKFDIEKAKIMFKNYIDWRIKENVDDIAKNYILPNEKEVKTYYPHGFHKTDKLGHPVYIELLGDVNLNEIFNVTSAEAYTPHLIRQSEREVNLMYPNCTEYYNKVNNLTGKDAVVIEDTVLILDLYGIGLTSLFGQTKKVVEIASSVGQDYYPENLHKMFMINCGFFFYLVWNLVKGFLDIKTRNKTVFLRYAYQEELLKYIDKENLPEKLGGTCKCEDFEGGCLFSDIGPWNPEGDPKYRIKK